MTTTLGMADSGHLLPSCYISHNTVPSGMVVKLGRRYNYGGWEGCKMQFWKKKRRCEFACSVLTWCPTVLPLVVRISTVAPF